MSAINRVTAVVLVVALSLAPFIAFFPSHVSARSLQDIQAEIDAKNKTLTQLAAQLKNAEASLNSAKQGLGAAQGEIPKLESEIKQIAAEVEINNIQITQGQELENLKSLEQEEREARMDEAIQYDYMQWRSDRASIVNSVNASKTKLSDYEAQVAETELGNVERLVGEIKVIQVDRDALEAENAELETKSADLASRKAQLEARIAQLRGAIGSGSGMVAGLRTQTSLMQASISQLSAEQKALQDYEAWILGQNGNGGTQPLITGEFYITGKGRELYTGHGVGMSQYGAFGLANNGWSASQILTHYYTGVSVGQFSASPEISIKYCQGNPVHAAYQVGCMLNGVDYGPVVTERVSLDQYLAGLGEMPNSWPLEARKAQMIAARTYALRYTGNGNPNNPICLSTYCQVSYIKNGDQAEMDAVTQTKDLVITYGGNLIEALYSADNNNGWGTADNDTVFSTIAGQGTPYPYLRAVRENVPVAVYPNYGHTWTWRTNSYSVQDFDAMLAFSQNNGNLSANSRNYIASIRAAIGNVSNINFERDPSDRVKRLIFVGTNGTSMPVAGWFFKTIWNSWVDQVMPTGQKDFIYSQTYFLLTHAP